MKTNKWRVNTGCNLGYDQSANKVCIHQILLIVTMDCTLKCKYCAHHCDVNHGTIDPAEIEQGIDGWSKKLSPHIVSVMGGEPLLNTKVEDYLLLCRKRWPGSNIRLVTNGLQLPQKPDSFFSMCEENAIEIAVSLHYQNERQENAIEELRRSGKSISISRVGRQWMKTYGYDSAGAPYPFWNEKYVESWEHCQLRHRCTAIVGKELYRCALLAAAAWGVRYGTMSGERWGFALDATRLLPDSPIEDIFHFYFDQSPLSCCGMCGSGKLHEIKRSR